MATTKATNNLLFIRHEIDTKKFAKMNNFVFIILLKYFFELDETV